MAPEVLIVGNRQRLADLTGEVETLGYQTQWCQPHEVARRIRTSAPPSTIIVSITDTDPRVFLATLRRHRQGSAIPVILFGAMGGDIRDLAEVLDIGADHFIDLAFDPEEVRSVLEELAGPVEDAGLVNAPFPMGEDEDYAEEDFSDVAPADPEPAPPVRASQGEVDDAALDDAFDMDDDRTSPPERTDPGRGTRGRTDPGRADVGRTDPGRTETRSDPARTDPGRADPALGHLHRTLDILEARLRAREQGRGNDEERELADMGLDAVPEVEGDDAPLDPTHQTRARSVGSGASHSRADSTVRLGAETVTSTSLSYGGEPTDTPPPEPFGIAESGSLDREDVAELLWNLARLRVEGRLTLRRGRVVKELWLSDAKIAFARSNLSQDRLVDRLLQRGLLTQEQYDAVRERVARDPRRAGELLIESGYLKPRELPGVLRDHLMRIVDSTFVWSGGSWSLVSGERCEEPVRLDRPIPEAIADGIRFRAEPDRLLGGLGGNTRAPRLNDSGFGGIGALHDVCLRFGFDDRKRHMLESLDGRFTVGDLLRDADDREMDILTTLYLAKLVGVIELLDAPVPDTSGGDAGQQIDRDRILGRLRLARETDYFEMLGVERDATSAQIRRAHEALAEVFSDARLERQTRESLVAELDELRAALDEAREILEDDAVRSAYLAHLESP